jgi:predicted NUDIX family NTP pyrophosphohydrolase
MMFRQRGGELEVFLVHPGGPFWQNKDLGAWSIPKGECLEGEDGLTAAKREFEEETGVKPVGKFIPLGDVKQPGGKVVTAWAVEGNCSTTILSNTFSMQWPPKSGQKREFPEVDRANWLPLHEAQVRLHRGQTEFLERLMASLRQGKAALPTLDANVAQPVSRKLDR